MQFKRTMWERQGVLVSGASRSKRLASKTHELLRHTEQARLAACKRASRWRGYPASTQAEMCGQRLQHSDTATRKNEGSTDQVFWSVLYEGELV